MKSKFIAAGAAVALIAGAGVWAGLGSATATTTQPSVQGWPGTASPAAVASIKADAAASGSQVLLLRAHEVRHANIDVGGDGFGPGDYFMFEEQLRYAHNDAVIGRDSVKCTISPTTFICDATAVIFGKGKIVAYGAFFSQANSRLAVTGGTGIYQGVGGQLLPVDQGGRNELLAFEIKR